MDLFQEQAGLGCELIYWVTAGDTFGFDYHPCSIKNTMELSQNGMLLTDSFVNIGSLKTPSQGPASDYVNQ